MGGPHAEGYSSKYSHRIRMEIIHLLGDKCVRCGFSDWRALQIDHVHGGGNTERRKITGTLGKIQYYRFVLRQIKLGSKDYQLLCANCNWIKRYEKKEYRKV